MASNIASNAAKECFPLMVNARIAAHQEVSHISKLRSANNAHLLVLHAIISIQIIASLAKIIVSPSIAVNANKNAQQGH